MIKVMFLVVLVSGCMSSADDATQVDAAVDADAPIDVPIDAVPDAAPAAKFLNVFIHVGPDRADSYVSVGFWLVCPAGAPDGPHDGAIEHHTLSGRFHEEPTEWTCEFNSTSVALFNVPCDTAVFGRVIIVHPLTGDRIVVNTQTMVTAACPQ